MRLKVSDRGLVIPPSLLAGLDEVEIRRQGDAIHIQKIENTSPKDPIEISMVKGEIAQQLLEEKLQIIRESHQQRPLDPAKVALAEKFRQLCQEIQEVHADNPFSEAEIAAEIDAVRSGVR